MIVPLELYGTLGKIRKHLRWDFVDPEAVVRRCSVKKVFLESLPNSQENSCVRVSFLINLQAEACNFIKKETLAHVFS